MKFHAYSNSKLLATIGSVVISGLCAFNVQALEQSELRRALNNDTTANKVGDSTYYNQQSKEVFDALGLTRGGAGGSSKAAVCGDSEPDDGEQCDDGNLANGDGCDSTCLVEVGFDCTASIAGMSNVNILEDGSFEDNNNGGEWTDIGHSLFGPNLICTDTCFGAPFAAGPDGSTISGNYVLIAGGSFDSSSTGNATHEAVSIPAEATTLEFQWATLASGPAGDPCAGPGDGLALSIGGTQVWSNLDGPVTCTNQNPYQRVIIDLATAPGGPYQGTTVAFEFTASATGAGTDLTNVMLDDVSINVPADPVIPPVASACFQAVCGDGILSDVEACDDGNAVAGDGCAADCTAVEEGFVCSDPTVDSFNVLNGDAGDALREGSLEDRRGRQTNDWDEIIDSDNGLLPICSEVFCSFISSNISSDGIFYGLFGASADPSDTSISQTTVIPTGANELTFDFFVASPADPGPCDSTSDFLEVTIDGTQVWVYDCVADVSLYTRQTVDISAFADDGEHTIVVRGVTEAVNTQNTNFFVDNLSIPLPTPAVATATPSACFEQDDLCGTIETFDAGIPAGWTVINLGPDPADGWGTTGDGTCLAQNAAGLVGQTGTENLTSGSGGAACADSDATGQVDNDGGGTPLEMDTFLCTDALDLSLITGPSFSFNAYYSSAGNEFNDNGTPDDFTDDFDEDLLEVLIGTQAPNALTIGNYTRLGGINDHEDGNLVLTGAQELSANLEGSALEGAAEGYVCFRYLGTFAWFAQVDNAALRGEICDVAPVDSDADGVFDSTDNCTDIPNAGQEDTNGDGIGNACDADINNDCIVNFQDIGQFPPKFGTAVGDAAYDENFDINSSGSINFLDYIAFTGAFGTAPGPSANACVPGLGN